MKHYRDFEEDISLLFPLDGMGELVALRCYIDAGENSSGIYCISGVSFSDREARKAERKWRKVLDGKAFHMTDLHARRGDFEDISDEKKMK